MSGTGAPGSVGGPQRQPTTHLPPDKLPAGAQQSADAANEVGQSEIAAAAARPTPHTEPLAGRTEVLTPQSWPDWVASILRYIFGGLFGRGQQQQPPPSAQEPVPTVTSNGPIKRDVLAKFTTSDASRSALKIHAELQAGENPSINIIPYTLNRHEAQQSRLYVSITELLGAMPVDYEGMAPIFFQFRNNDGSISHVFSSENRSLFDDVLRVIREGGYEPLTEEKEGVLYITGVRLVMQEPQRGPDSPQPPPAAPTEESTEAQAQANTTPPSPQEQPQSDLPQTPSTVPTAEPAGASPQARAKPSLREVLNNTDHGASAEELDDEMKKEENPQTNIIDYKTAPSLHLTIRGLVKKNPNDQRDIFFQFKEGQDIKYVFSSEDSPLFDEVLEAIKTNGWEPVTITSAGGITYITGIRRLLAKKPQEELNTPQMTTEASREKKKITKRLRKTAADTTQAQNTKRLEETTAQKADVTKQLSELAKERPRIAEGLAAVRAAINKLEPEAKTMHLKQERLTQLKKRKAELEAQKAALVAEKERISTSLRSLEEAVAQARSAQLKAFPQKSRSPEEYAAIEKDYTRKTEQLTEATDKAPIRLGEIDREDSNLDREIKKMNAEGETLTLELNRWENKIQPLKLQESGLAFQQEALDKKEAELTSELQRLTTYEDTLRG